MVNVYWSERTSSLQDHLFHCFTTLFNSQNIGSKHRGKTHKHSLARSNAYTHTDRGVQVKQKVKQRTHARTHTHTHTHTNTHTHNTLLPSASQKSTICREPIKVTAVFL